MKAAKKMASREVAMENTLSVSQGRGAHGIFRGKVELRRRGGERREGGAKGKGSIHHQCVKEMWDTREGSWSGGEEEEEEKGGGGFIRYQ